MANQEYIIIPGTQQRIYEGSVVILYRLPNLRWILHYGYYNYNGKKQKGWYFSSIPADTTMPVFNEDLVALQVIDDPHPTPEPIPPFPPGPGPIPPFPPFPPFPPGPGPHPGPPAPIPIPYTPQDKAQVDAAMITVETLRDRDRMASSLLQNGKIVRVNDADGQGGVEYYSWNAEAGAWDEASLGYRYMTRDEIDEAIGDDIVSIVWSNEDGALVLTNNAGTEVDPVQLLGVAHNPVYTSENLTLRIPIYGHEDLVMVIPKDRSIQSIGYEEHWTFEDHHVAPAIVVTVSDGEHAENLACDVSALMNIYTGSDTSTVKVQVNSETNAITADIKLSGIPNNVLKVDDTGLWVDLSGVVAKKQIQQGFLLIADGNGEFTYAGDGVQLDSTTAISDLADPSHTVVTANLVADAINVAVSALAGQLQPVIDEFNNRIASLESRFNITSGADGAVVVTDNNGIQRSLYQIGGSEVDVAHPEGKLATEEALVKVSSWKSF